MRILIADDHPVVRLGLKQLLGSHSDLTVVGEAKNCNETLDLARRLDWDVAVIDYSMPDRNGLELLKDLKRAYPRRPILVLSMYPEELHATRVLKAGASGYINKESASEDLANAIRKAMTGGKYVSATLAERLADQIGADGDRPLHDRLSDREYRVMWLLASGRQIKRIAREMTLSASTISTYRTRILKKLHLVSNAELVQYAIRHKLIDA
jgi:two-component system invasion response regulator UvrY